MPPPLIISIFQHQGLSSKSALHIRWPKYWSFRFSISPSNEDSGLIYFRMDWFDLPAVQRTLKSLLQQYEWKASILHSAFFMVQLTSIHDYWKTIALTIGTCVHKVTPLLSNTLSRFVITSLPRSKCFFNFMAAVTIHSDLEPQGDKICHCFQFLPFYLPQRDGTGCHDLGFVNVEFQVSFFTLLIHPHQEDLSSSFFSAFRVVSSAYQWLLIFLLEILIPACDFSSLAFHMIHSPYKLNKQGDTYSLDILISQF